MVYSTSFHFCVLFLAIFGVVQTVQGISQSVSEGPSADDTQCGGVLEAFNEFSTLTYKYQKRVSPPESCIWTIHAPNRTLIKLTLLHVYFFTTSDYISLGYFNNSNYDQLNSLTWQRLTTFHPQEIELPGPVAFVHYVSTAPAAGLGFRLTYESAGEIQSSVNNYENYFFEGEYGAFHYPPKGGQYLANVRTTVVIKAVPVGDNRAELAIQNMIVEASENCVKDSVSFFTMFANGTGWTREHSLCATQTGSYIGMYFNRPRNDPIIVTFKSDESGLGNGFELFWSHWE